MVDAGDEVIVPSNTYIATWLAITAVGAKVVPVEPTPNGDNTRRLVGAGAGFFMNFNRNKRSIRLDLRKPEAA